MVANHPWQPRLVHHCHPPGEPSAGQNWNWELHLDFRTSNERPDLLEHGTCPNANGRTVERWDRGHPVWGQPQLPGDQPPTAPTATEVPFAVGGAVSINDPLQLLRPRPKETHGTA